MKSKKLLALLMSAALAVSSFSACAASETSSEETSSSAEDSSSSETEETKLMDGDVEVSAPGEYPIVIGDTVTITAFGTPGSDSKTEHDSDLCAASAWFEELTNVHIEWTLTTSADKTAKLNLLFQSGEYEDIIFGSGWDGAVQTSYAEQGYIISLNDYIENDAYWYNEFVDALLEEELVEQSSLDTMYLLDGNIYSMYSIATTYHTQYASKMWIYEPWLDTLDLDMPTTTDEFYDVLTAFKTEDPNGNGIADEIPLSGANGGWNSNPIEFLMNSFTYYDISGKTYVNDGVVTLSYTEDEFKDGLIWMNMLYEEGLLSQDAFVQDASGLKILTTGEVNLVGCAPGGSIASVTTVTTGVDGDWTNWVALAPLEGPDGVQYSKYSPITPTANAQITDNCEYARVAFKLIDALYDWEGVGYNLYQGEDYWELYPEDTVAINGESAKYLTWTPDELNFGWSVATVWTGGPGWHSYQAMASESADIDNEAILYNSSIPYEEYAPSIDYILPSLIYDEDDSDAVVDYTTALNEYVNAETVDMILTGDIEEKWEQYLSDIEARGSNELLEIQQAAYEARVG
ncbi:MAG: hypothetical protein R3Y33_03225 [Clostridia bacterium]